jgi:hypothetical protein
MDHHSYTDTIPDTNPVIIDELYITVYRYIGTRQTDQHVGITSTLQPALTLEIPDSRLTRCAHWSQPLHGFLLL